MREQIVGLCGLKHAPREGRANEIGYSIAKNERGQGLATRAVALMLEEVAHRVPGQPVEAETDHDNRASQRVLEKNGFVRLAEGSGSDHALIRWRWTPGAL